MDELLDLLPLLLHRLGLDLLTQGRGTCLAHHGHDPTPGGRRAALGGRHAGGSLGRRRRGGGEHFVQAGLVAALVSVHRLCLDRGGGAD